MNDSKLQIVIKAKDEASKVFGKFQGNIKSMQPTFRKMALVGTASFTAMSVGVGKATQSAVNAQEIFSKFDTVFDDVGNKAEEVAEDLRTNFGLAESTAKDLLSATGDLLSGFGFTGDAALELSGKTQKLAIDLASFTNLQGGAARASEILTKAILGEKDSLVSLGIKILDSDVNNRLLLEGKDKLTGLSLRQAKAEITLQLAMEQSGKAIGDYERTSEGAANQQRLLQERTKELSETIGMIFVPILKDVIEKVVPVINKMRDWAEENPELVKQIVLSTLAIAGIVAGIGILGLTLPSIITGFGLLSATIKMVTGFSVILLPYIVTMTKGFVNLTKAIYLTRFSIIATLAPVALIIGAVVVLIKLVKHQIETFDQFGKSLEVIANYLKKGLSKVLEYVSGKIKNLTRDISILVRALGEAVEDSAITKLGEKIGASIEWGMGKAGIAVENTMSDIGYITDVASNRIQDGMSSAGNFIVEKWQGVKNSVLGSTEDILGGMGETTEKMMEEFENSMKDLEDANANATEKLSESGKKIQDNFKKYISTVKDFNTGVKDEIESTIGKIAELQQKLVDVEKEYNEKRKDNNMSYAQAYLDQENKIKDTKEEIANTSDASDRNRLQSKLSEQISVLEQFSSLEKTYHAEIEYLRGEALKSELQRQVEKLKQKEWHEMAEYSRVKEKILKEITAETKKYEDLKALQTKGLEEYAKYLNSSEQMTADSINREIAKYNELAEAVEKARQAQSSYSGYSFSVQNAISGLRGIGNTMNDFISRPGSAPVSFSPQDTIIGVKNTDKIGGGGSVINITINGDVSGEELIEKVKDSLWTELKLNGQVAS